MQHKPDPKPGRWILPLIIIAMVGFTYVFTSSITPTLPDVTVAPIDVGTDNTTGPDTTEGDTAVITEDTAPTVDPEVTAYIAQLEGFIADLDAANTQLVDANAGWDARTIKYGETKTAFQEAAASLQTWSNSVSASIPPASVAALQLPHQDIIDATVTPVDEAKKALDGLVNSESTVPRRDAIQRFSSAVDDFKAKVAAALAIANG